VAHTGCTASIWNASTTQKILDIFHPKGVKALVSSSKGKFLALAGCDGNVAVWNINLEEKILPLQLKYQVEKFAVSSNSSTELLFALVHSDNFHLHQINFRPPLIHVQQSAIVDIAFSTDEKYFIVGRLNGIAVVYDTTTGQEITRITHEKEMSAIAFSPNGKYLVTASGCKARIWAACTAKEIGYTNLQGRINVVAFSPDGKFLAIATGDSFSQKKEYGDFQLIGFSNLLNRC
jgi:WD40 repeat protein